MAKGQGQNARLPQSDNLGVIHNHQQIDAASISEQFADTGANGRYGIDRETEIEMQVVSQMEKEEECADDDDLPFQLTSYNCYGREKSLNDVSLPRIPAVLECLVLPCTIDYDYTVGLLYQNKPASRRDFTLGATGGRGRQLMASINSLNANQVQPGGRTFTGTEQSSDLSRSSSSSSLFSSSSTSFGTVPSQRNSRSGSSSILFDDDHFRDFLSSASIPTKKNNRYDVTCSDDFPSLGVSATAEGVNENNRAVGRGRSRSNRKKGGSKAGSVGQGTRGSESSVSDITSNSGLSATDQHLPGSSLDANSMKTTHDQLCINGNDGLAENGKFQDCDVVSENETNVEAHTSRLLRGDDVDILVPDSNSQNRTSCDKNTDNKTPEREYVNGVAKTQSKTENVASRTGMDVNGFAEIKNKTENAACRTTEPTADELMTTTETSEKIAAKTTNETENTSTKTDSTTDESVAGTKTEKRKKKKGGWKLEGPLVVHFDNVPKKSGQQLKDYLSSLGNIVGEEKKNMKFSHMNSWRFQFQDGKICQDVVDFGDGAEDLLDGQSAPLKCYRLMEEEVDVEL